MYILGTGQKTNFSIWVQVLANNLPLLEEASQNILIEIFDTFNSPIYSAVFLVTP